MTTEENKKIAGLAFTPRCPNCHNPIDIERSICGLYAKCDNCGNDYAASPFTDPVEEGEWLKRFNVEDVAIAPRKPEPELVSPKTLFEIGHANEILKQAYKKVSEAYDLIQHDEVARRYIDFSASITWPHFVWDILMKEFDRMNPDSKEVYFLRAFDYFKIQPGMDINGCPQGGN